MLGVCLVYRELRKMLLCRAGDGSMTTLLRAYIHRANADGTTVSICQRCYLSVATALREADLERAEARHSCERERLRQLEMTHKQPFEATWTPEN